MRPEKCGISTNLGPCDPASKSRYEFGAHKGQKNFKGAPNFFSPGPVHALHGPALRKRSFRFDDISAICWWILMQNSVLETLLVVDHMTEIWKWNFKIFVEKMASKIEIWWGKCTVPFWDQKIYERESPEKLYLSHSGKWMQVAFFLESLKYVYLNHSSKTIQIPDFSWSASNKFTWGLYGRIPNKNYPNYHKPEQRNLERQNIEKPLTIQSRVGRYL